MGARQALEWNWCFWDHDQIEQVNGYDMLPEDVEGFTGTTSSLYRFMKRKNLVLRQKQGKPFS